MMASKNIHSRPAEPVETFIAAAPDAASSSKKTTSKAQQITLTLNPLLLDKVDAAADNLNLSRAAFIKMCLSNAVKE
jgi:hypothetical protein